MRTVINKTDLLTLKDLRDFMNSTECLALNENAFVWLQNDTDEWNIDCATSISIDTITTPEDGFPQEKGIQLSCKRIRNKANP